MRALTAGTNIDEATTDYPNGRVRDKSGSTEGTLLNEVLVGDFIQFLQKLVIDSGIVVNNLPDNATNGYQLLTALVAKISEISLAKDNTEEYVPDGDYNPATKIFVNQGGTQIAWADGINVSSKLSTDSFLRCCMVGPIVYIYGEMQTSSYATEDEVLYTLPNNFPDFTEPMEFSAVGSEPTEVYELKLATGTKNVVAGAGQASNSTNMFWLAIPII